MISKRPRLILLLGGAFSFLLVVALRIRLPQLGRGVWEDEVHHNYPILISNSLLSLRANLDSQLQPILEYFIRKNFWFPLIGHQENGLRIPSLVYSLAGIVFGIGFAFAVFLRRGFSFLSCAALTLSVALWQILHPTEIYYSAEARHYTFVGLCSLVWSAFFFFRAKRDWAFWLVTFFYLNSHFFSLSVVCPLVGLEFLSHLRSREYKESLKLLLFSLGLGLVTIKVNYPELSWLFRRPPNQLVGASVQDSLSSGLEIFSRLFAFFSIQFLRPILQVSAALMLVIGLLFKETRGRSFQILVILFLVVPGFFLYIRYRSSYSFEGRYFTPWFGIGWVLLLSIFLNWIELIRAVPFLKKAAPLLVGVIALIGSPVTKLFSGYPTLNTEWASINHSPYFRIYEEIKDLNKPTFILTSHCYGDDIPKMYFGFMGAKFQNYSVVMDSMGCRDGERRVRQELERFIGEYKDGILVLDQKQSECSNSVPDGVLRSKHSNCVWLVKRLKSPKQLKAVAQQMKFSARPGIFESL